MYFLDIQGTCRKHDKKPGRKPKDTACLLWKHACRLLRLLRFPTDFLGRRSYVMSQWQLVQRGIIREYICHFGAGFYWPVHVLCLAPTRTLSVIAA